MPNDEPKSRDWRADTGTSYDKIAEHYATEYFDELSRKPFDCELLTRFAQSLPAGARVCDIGCGPGHIARYLAKRSGKAKRPIPVSGGPPIFHGTRQRRGLERGIARCLL